MINMPAGSRHCPEEQVKKKTVQPPQHWYREESDTVPAKQVNIDQTYYEIVKKKEKNQFAVDFYKYSKNFTAF